MADPIDTKQRILDAAEALFAEHGFAHTSMRAITGRAGANLAAVNYHFGSKEELIKAVLSRRLEPVNEERLRRLRALQDAGEPSLERLLEAFIAAPLEASRGEQGDTLVKLVGRSFTEQTEPLRDHVRELNRELVASFKPAFARALPQLPPAELSLRLHFLVGAVSYTMNGSDRIPLPAGSGAADSDTPRALLDRLIPFLAGGLRAPLSIEQPAAQPAEPL
jgi:AcrR family transcriptional regulator